MGFLLTDVVVTNQFIYRKRTLIKHKDLLLELNVCQWEIESTPKPKKQQFLYFVNAIVFL